MTIDYLANHPEHLATLAGWHFDEWGELTGERSVERYTEQLRLRAGRRAIPSVLVAISHDDLLGSASLVAHDMEIRPDLSPWLAQVYVAPPFRRTGVGSALVRRVAEEATAVGASTLYLYTQPLRREFYARLDWTVREYVAYMSKDRVVMELTLTANPSVGRQSVRPE